jgi:hypothetical protein
MPLSRCLPLNIQHSFPLCIRRSTVLGMVCRSALTHRHKRGETKRPFYIVGLPFARSVASNCPPVPLKATLDLRPVPSGGHPGIAGCKYLEAIRGCSVNGSRRARLQASDIKILWISGDGRVDHQDRRHAADRRRRRRR